MTITEALTAEHCAFIAVFDCMERMLPTLGTTQELKLLINQVHGMTARHSEAETELAFVALDQVLADRGALEHLYEDHREMGEHLKRAGRAASLQEGVGLFKQALAFSRDHFRHEEQVVFPLIDRELPPTMLEQLGAAWLQRYLEGSPNAIPPDMPAREAMAR